MIVNCYLLFFLLCSSTWKFSDSFLTQQKCVKLNRNKNNQQKNIIKLNTYRKNYHFSQRYTEELLKRMQIIRGVGNATMNNANANQNIDYYETLLKKLNSKNETMQNISILGEEFDSFYRNINLNLNKSMEQPRV